MKQITIILFTFLLAMPGGLLTRASEQVDCTKGDDLTISYSITIRSKRSNTGIAETYNGGVETFFTDSRQARLRLVSLMRVQSIFFSGGKKITLIKESGKIKHKTTLTQDQWNTYNKKYEGATCKMTEDTAQVLHHLCKQAVITLKDGRKITAWYTTAIQKPLLARLEPAFSGIPGLVLKYEYTYRKKTISYTATAISQTPISPEVFVIPGE